jgi:hypothetical protein
VNLTFSVGHNRCPYLCANFPYDNQSRLVCGAGRHFNTVIILPENLSLNKIYTMLELV